MRLRPLVVTSLVTGLGIALLGAAPACTTDSTYVQCDEVVTRCRTVCETWCDGWGCWPSCYDQCWDECHRYEEPPPAEPAPEDAGPSPSPGKGVLCSPCTSNDQCGDGALCIARGGEGGGDAGAATSFCGSPCASSADCPSGFTCTRIGSSSQCLPSDDACR